MNLFLKSYTIIISLFSRAAAKIEIFLIIGNNPYICLKINNKRMKRLIIILLAIAGLVSCKKESAVDKKYHIGEVLEYEIDSAHATIDGESGFPFGYDIKSALDEEPFMVEGISSDFGFKYEDGYKYKVIGKTYVHDYDFLGYPQIHLKMHTLCS